MGRLGKARRGRSYELSAATLNELIRSKNEWDSLRVQVVVTATEPTKLVRSEGRCILRIAIPPSSSGAGLPEGYTFKEFTYCEDGAPVTEWWPTWPTNPEAEE